MSDVSWNTTLSLLWLIQAVNLIGVVAIGGIETGESVQLLKGANLRDT